MILCEDDNIYPIKSVKGFLNIKTRYGDRMTERRYTVGNFNNTDIMSAFEKLFYGITDAIHFVSF